MLCSLLILILIYLIWVNYKSSPKRILESLWGEIHNNSKKIYDANEANEDDQISILEKENDKKGDTINIIVNYYYDKNSTEYRYYKYDSENNQLL